MTQKEVKTDALRDISKAWFDDDKKIMILDGGADRYTQSLKGKAIWVDRDVEVMLTKHLGNTLISFIDRNAEDPIADMILSDIQRATTSDQVKTIWQLCKKNPRWPSEIQGFSLNNLCAVKDGSCFGNLSYEEWNSRIRWSEIFHQHIGEVNYCSFFIRFSYEFEETQLLTIYNLVNAK